MTTPHSLQRFFHWTFAALATVCLVAAAAPAIHARVVRLAVVQGGDYAAHAALSQGVVTEVRRLLPDSIEIVTPPDAYVNGGWNIERFREGVAGLAASDRADIALAIGPWSVEALLNAGWDKPIVAAFRFDPIGEGLLDGALHPVAPNLSVTSFPDRYYEDFLAATQLLSIDTVAVLKFESNPEDTALPSGMVRRAEQLGITVIPVRGYTPRGEYAFFKAYQQVPKNADALYVSPLWGLQTDAIKQFLAMAVRDRRPVIASDGAYLVERGALVSGAGRTWATEAVIVAWKLSQIMEGRSPSELTAVHPQTRSMSVHEATAERCGIMVDDRLRGEAIVYSEVAAGDRYDFALAQATAVSRAAKAPLDSLDSLVTAEYLGLLQAECEVEIQRAALAAMDGFYERAHGLAVVDLLDQRQPKRLRAERVNLETGMYAVLSKRLEAKAALARALSFAPTYPLHIDTSIYSEHVLMMAYHRMSDSLSSPAIRASLLEDLLVEVLRANRRAREHDIRLDLYVRLLQISEKLQAASSLYEANHEAHNVLLMLQERPNDEVHDAIDAIELIRSTGLEMLHNRMAFFRECAELASVMGWKSEGNWQAPVDHLIAAIQSGAGEVEGR